MSDDERRRQDFQDRHPGYSVAVSLAYQSSWTSSPKTDEFYSAEVYHDLDGTLIERIGARRMNEVYEAADWSVRLHQATALPDELVDRWSWTSSNSFRPGETLTLDFYPAGLGTAKHSHVECLVGERREDLLAAIHDLKLEALERQRSFDEAI